MLRGFSRDSSPQPQRLGNDKKLAYLPEALLKHIQRVIALLLRND